jgi:uncharacterized membrane protein (UPF0136 family)
MMNTPDALLLAVLGVITAVWGYKLARLWVSLLSGITLGYVFYQYSSYELQAALTPLVLFVIGFIVGAMIGFVIFKLAISLVAGFAIAQLLISAGIFVANETALIILTIVFAMILYAIVDKLLAFVFIIGGAALFFIGLLAVQLPMVIVAILTLLIIVLGIYKNIRR